MTPNTPFGQNAQLTFSDEPAPVKSAGDVEVANSDKYPTRPAEGESRGSGAVAVRRLTARAGERPGETGAAQDSGAADEAVARCESGVGSERPRLTYRERREARAEQRREWAGARQRDGDGARQRHHEIADRIPFGQPILVGHHSERSARADQRRLENLRDKAVENWSMASRHEHAADSIESQLRTSIYRDDVDAVERLEAKVAKLEAQREHVKAKNAAYRREHAAELRGMSAYERSQAVPFAPYVLTNLSATIRRTRERVVEAQQVRDGDRGFGRSMESRYGGTCPDCGADFEKGDPIVYYRRTREAVCADCATEGVPA